MEELFEAIYREYFSRVYAFLFKLSKQSDLAEELTQETFYQAFISFHRFEGKCEIFTWLAAIAKHTYYKYLKKNRLGLDMIDFTELERNLTDESRMGENPADVCQRNFQRENVAEAVKNLPQKYRDVVILRIYADMPFSQIAAIMGITENSAKVIFFRAKKKLSEELNDEFNL